MKPDLQALSVYADESFVNYQEAGKYKSKNKKVYVQLNSANKKYVVHKDSNNKKYVMTKGNKVLLQSIRGKYKYTQ